MESWENVRSTINGLKPTLLMVFVQAMLSLVNIVFKLAANDGMSLPVLVAYRLMFGAACIAPVAFFLERQKRTKLTWTVGLYGFLCGLFGGALGQNLHLKSLTLTSATYISAMFNLIPVVTFVMSICLRLERLGWNSMAGKAKVLGTILGLGGAVVFTFYKGPVLNIFRTGINLLEITSTHHQTSAHTQGGRNLVLGLLLALASVLCYSLWLIIQAKADELYPFPYSITAMMTIWGSIQGTIYALCVERDWNQWILGWNVRLLAVLVAGVLGSGTIFTLIAWCVRMRGPVFVSVFNPLMLVMVAIVGNLFLEEKLHLGMVFGSVLVIFGLYSVLWGKSKEMKKLSKLTPENTEAGVRPLSSRKGSGQGGGSKKGEAEEEEENIEERRVSHEASSNGMQIYVDKDFA